MICVALETQIDHVGSSAASNSERSHALDRCSAGIAQLSREVQDAAATIPAYDHKTYIEVCSKLRVAARWKKNRPVQDRGIFFLLSASGDCAFFLISYLYI